MIAVPEQASPIIGESACAAALASCDIDGPGPGANRGRSKHIGGVNHRKAPRYQVHWKVALVFDQAGHKHTFHGRTLDLSLVGTSMLTDRNINISSPLVLLLAPPALYPGHRQQIMEIHARQVYAVYSGATECFRLGFEFTTFEGDGLRLLQERLAHHFPKAFSPPSS